MAKETKKETPSKFRKPLRRLALVMIGVGAATGMAVYLLHHYMVNDPKFMLSHDRRDALTISGLRYGSRAKVQRIFSEDADHSVFSVPLAERRRRLLAIDWVQDASVSRVWPDHLAVNIRERQPLAFVQVQSSVMLIDQDGMLLDPPAKAQFTFPVLKGVRAEDPPEKRREAVQGLQDVEKELGAQMKDVSEVDASDPGNIRIVVQVQGHVADLILGEDNFAARYRNFLQHYPDIHRRSPEVKTFDLRLDDRIMAKE